MKNQENFLYEIEELSFAYPLGSQKIEAIRNLSLKIPKSSLVALCGPSGSGKSTLLNILGLIEPVQKGQVLFQDEDLNSISRQQKNTIRRSEIGFIFQQFHLMPVLTAEENVAFFLKGRGLTRSEIKQRTQEALEAVGLWEHRKQKPSQLSGGQRQRVAIARAIAKKPSVIIADEPTASLDQATGHEIMRILIDMVRNRGVSVILTTHDPMVQSFADHHFYMQDGQIVIGKEQVRSA